MSSKEIQMVPVQSSNLAEIGYDENQSRLYIRFRDKMRLYRYNRVPEIVWRGLLQAPSKGSFFQQQINPHFDYEVVEEE